MNMRWLIRRMAVEVDPARTHLSPLGILENSVKERYIDCTMTAIAQKLDEKLAEWSPQLVHDVEALVENIIELADADGLDILRSRKIEQEVLDLLDED